MDTNVCQRWRDRRGSYRPAGEPIVTADYEVSAIDERTAKAFVLQHHYAASYPAARFRFGLYRRGGALVGVAVFSHPASDAVLSPLPGKGLERTELGRLVLLDDVPANGESWTIARCFDLLHRDSGIVGVISFSDPCPRTDITGRQVFKGHLGSIYQSSNAVYTGRTKAETLRLMADGTVMPGRSITKIRKRDKGWKYAAARLQDAGAEPLRDDEDSRAWAELWLPRLTRKFKHTGNHRYLFGLDTRARKELLRRPDRQSYPKFDLLAEAA